MDHSVVGQTYKSVEPGCFGKKNPSRAQLKLLRAKFDVVSGYVIESWF